jgi:putative flippase GtrA
MVQRAYFLIRYLVGGLSGAVIQVATLYVWVTLLGFEQEYLAGVVIGFILALIVTFALQKYWTFRDRASDGASRQFVTYGIVALIGLALNAGLLAGARYILERASVDFFHGWYIAAQVIIIIIVSAFNFAANFLITFRRARVSGSWEGAGPAGGSPVV